MMKSLSPTHDLKYIPNANKIFAHFWSELIVSCTAQNLYTAPGIWLAMQVRVPSNIKTKNCHGVFQIVSGLKEMRQCTAGLHIWKKRMKKGLMYSSHDL